MSTDTQETLDDIERDLSVCFENFRTTPPETYMSATPAASIGAAQMFMRRLQNYFRHYKSPEEVESAIQEARKAAVKDFAEHAHSYYLGCGRKEGDELYEYSYSTEVVHMVDDFFGKEAEAASLTNSEPTNKTLRGGES